MILGYSRIPFRVLWDHFGFTFGTILRVPCRSFEGNLGMTLGVSEWSLGGYSGITLEESLELL